MFYYDSLAKNSKANINESVNLVRSNLNIMSSVIDLINVEEFDGDGLDIMGTDGFNSLEGSSLADYIDAKAGSDFIDAKRGSDLIMGGLGDDFIFAKAGDDSVLGGGGRDVIFGGDGQDIILAGDGNDVVLGGDGDDIIYGDLGNDTVLGGDGDDTIIGSHGSDLLFGKAGADVFEFSADKFDARYTTQVEDFELGEDSLVIKGLNSDDDVSLDGAGRLSVNGDFVISLKNLENPSDVSIELNEDGEFEIM